MLFPLYSPVLVIKVLPDAGPRAGAGIYLHPDADAEGQFLQTESFKYYWTLAHTDPTSGVQVNNLSELIIRTLDRLK